MGVLALVHGFSFIIPNEAYLTSGSAFWSEGSPTFLLFGIIAMWLSVPLTLTSSKWAMRRLGRHWKTLHRLVYVIVIFAVAHVVILQSMRQFDITPILFLALYFIFKVLEWRGYSFAKKNSGS
jgi:DMSO/TMAO reductase YedYZ heme-binding membrane subunit